MKEIIIKNKYYNDDIKIYLINYNLTQKQLNHISKLIINEVSHEYSHKSDMFDKNMIFIIKKNGVTDDESKVLEKIIKEEFKINKENFVFTVEVKSKNENLSKYNPVIYTFRDSLKECKNYHKNNKLTENNDLVETINLDIDDKSLIKLSEKRHLSLNLEELKTIKKYFLNPDIKKLRLEKGLSDITDCELETIAQTWSEHCKHKEFNSLIIYEDKETSQHELIDGLFETYIKKATDTVSKNLGENNFLIKVFNDNSGIVRIDENNFFTFKVETHNSPSAIDPYGGALTGILGNNRDPLGTGKGGGKLIFNTDILCFASPNYNKKLLKNQLHPKIIQKGVVNGIKDGGNKTGIPTINGAVIYDDRFSGKPLVFCGTGGILPAKYQEKPTHKKEIKNGYIIYMLGGRVGKDGIHGATFSSRILDETSPLSAVQIGSPFTQKKAMDFLLAATLKGLIDATTDNGAGGLASSVGELATISNGAKVFLDQVPLKYKGLKPWEIFVSESQERFTLAVNPKNKKEIEILAEFYDVELTNIGEFTDNGFLEVYYDKKIAAFLNLDFLHNGVPKKTIHAEWKKPEFEEPDFNKITINYEEIIKKLISSDNIKSKEEIIRQYDHEVQGNTILKPLMGETLKAPQDAGIINLDDQKAIIVTNGINPKYGDINAYDMSCSAFDEAIRSVISVGGEFPDKNRFWSVNDNFCMPNIIYDEKTNKNGKYKAAQLVKMCQALYDTSTFFNIPFTSGKDSMKNDFYSEGKKISIPPTILYSVTALLENIDNIITSEFKNPGDLIYLLGETYDETGGSEFFKLLGFKGNKTPKLRFEKAKELYDKFITANKNKLIESSHDISDGGMIITLIESTFGNNNLGANINISSIKQPPHIALFSESNSRFIVSIRPENKQKFEEIFKNRAFLLGKVTSSPHIEIHFNKHKKIILNKDELLNKWG